MATKFKMKYGQYTEEVAKQLSLNPVGTVVYSGLTKQIWVDGKCIAANFQGGIDYLKGLIGELQELKTLSKDNLVAAINELYDNKADLTYVDSKIDETKAYVDAQIDEILGSSDLEETLDTIKEIQEELLKDAKYFVTYTDGSETSEVEVERRLNEETGKYEYVLPGTDTVVATETGDESDPIDYEEGYSDLERQNVIDSLMDNITENRENIENIENKELVSDITVSENEEKNFVTETESNEIDEYGLKTKAYTIGVKYGEFKTGHGNVMDPESTGYNDGIATVKGVQDYIEERIVWSEFVSSANEIANDITTDSDPEYTVPGSTELDEPLVIG